MQTSHCVQMRVCVCVCVAPQGGSEFIQALRLVEWWPQLADHKGCWHNTTHTVTILLDRHTYFMEDSLSTFLSPFYNLPVSHWTNTTKLTGHSCWLACNSSPSLSLSHSHTNTPIYKPTISSKNPFFFYCQGHTVYCTAFLHSRVCKMWAVKQRAERGIHQQILSTFSQILLQLL